MNYACQKQCLATFRWLLNRDVGVSQYICIELDVNLLVGMGWNWHLNSVRNFVPSIGQAHLICAYISFLICSFILIISCLAYDFKVLLFRMDSDSYPFVMMSDSHAIMCRMSHCQKMLSRMLHQLLMGKLMSTCAWECWSTLNTFLQLLIVCGHSHSGLWTEISWSNLGRQTMWIVVSRCATFVQNRTVQLLLLEPKLDCKALRKILMQDEFDYINANFSSLCV